MKSGTVAVYSLDGSLLALTHRDGSMIQHVGLELVGYERFHSARRKSEKQSRG